MGAVYIILGFKPALVIIKPLGVADWSVYDDQRPGSNPANRVFLNKTDAEDASTGIDLNANGFQLKTANASVNEPGTTHLYMAFA